MSAQSRRTWPQKSNGCPGVPVFSHGGASRPMVWLRGLRLLARIGRTGSGASRSVQRSTSGKSVEAEVALLRRALVTRNLLSRVLGRKSVKFRTAGRPIAEGETLPHELQP